MIGSRVHNNGNPAALFLLRRSSRAPSPALATVGSRNHFTSSFYRRFVLGKREDFQKWLSCHEPEVQFRMGVHPEVSHKIRRWHHIMRNGMIHKHKRLSKWVADLVVEPPTYRRACSSYNRKHNWFENPEKASEKRSEKHQDPLLQECANAEERWQAKIRALRKRLDEDPVNTIFPFAKFATPLWSLRSDTSASLKERLDRSKERLQHHKERLDKLETLCRPPSEPLNERSSGKYEATFSEGKKSTLDPNGLTRAGSTELRSTKNITPEMATETGAMKVTYEYDPITNRMIPKQKLQSIRDQSTRRDLNTSKGGMIRAEQATDKMKVQKQSGSAYVHAHPTPNVSQKGLFSQAEPSAYESDESQIRITSRIHDFVQKWWPLVQDFKSRKVLPSFDERFDLTWDLKRVRGVMQSQGHLTPVIDQILEVLDELDFVSNPKHPWQAVAELAEFFENVAAANQASRAPKPTLMKLGTDNHTLNDIDALTPEGIRANMGKSKRLIHSHNFGYNSQTSPSPTNIASTIESPNIKGTTAEPSSGSTMPSNSSPRDATVDASTSRSSSSSSSPLGPVWRRDHDLPRVKMEAPLEPSLSRLAAGSRYQDSTKAIVPNVVATEQQTGASFEQINAVKSDGDVTKIPKSLLGVERRLSAEIAHQKAAMQAHEDAYISRQSKESKNPSLSKQGKAQNIDFSAEAKGEGDMCVNVVKYARDDRWYKKPAPHAIAAEEAKRAAHEQDRALASQIRRIYEDYYGIIDVNHRQPSTSSTVASQQKVQVDEKIHQALKDYEQTRESVPSYQAKARGDSQDKLSKQHVGRQPSYGESANSSFKISSYSTDETSQSPRAVENLSIPSQVPIQMRKAEQSYKIFSSKFWSPHVIESETIDRVPTTAPENPIPLSEALAKLDEPAGFLPMIREHLNNGYEIVGATEKRIVLRAQQHGSPLQPSADKLDKDFHPERTTLNACTNSVDGSSALEPSTDELENHTRSEETRSEASINPVDGTSIPNPPATGNFASPTGFVNYGETPSISSRPRVKREERVFSGKPRPLRGAGSKRRRRAARRKVLMTVFLTVSGCYAVGWVSERMR